MEFDELIPSLENISEITWKLQKANNAWKTYKYIFCCVGAKAQVKYLQKYLNPSFPAFTWLVIIFHLERFNQQSHFY